MVCARQFYIPYTSYPLRSCFLVSLWNITLLLAARPKAHDRVIYDPRMREYKSDVVAFYSATRKRERRRVKMFPQSSFTRFSVLNGTIVATMGIYKSRYKSSFHVSGQTIDEPCTPAALTFSEDGASMQKREKETVSACAHVYKKDKESKRRGEEKRGAKSYTDLIEWIKDDKQERWWRSYKLDDDMKRRDMILKVSMHEIRLLFHVTRRIIWVTSAS